MVTRARLRQLFPDPADRAVATAVAATIQEAGISEAHVDAWLRVGADVNERLGAGILSREDQVAFTERAASALGIPEGQLAAIGSLPMFEQNADGSPVLPAEPSPQHDAALIEAAERLMRDDFPKYVATLQERYADALDRQQERAAAAGQGDTRSTPSGDDTGATAAGPDRMRELEGLMGDLGSSYWRGAGAEKLQSEYRQLAAAAPSTADASGANSEQGA
jgi:hypothetical protein